VLLAAAALLLAGCGYVGDPLPPLMRIPTPVEDLVAVQRGEKIIVPFTVPRLTTEGTVLTEPPALDLRAGPAPRPFDPHGWAAGAKQFGEGPVENGRARYELPVNGWPGQEIAVGVRAVGPSGRDGGWSNFATVSVVLPLARPVGVRAEAAPQGVRVSWQGSAPLFRIFRRAPGEERFSHASDVAAAQWIDTAAEYGKTYSYLVQAIMKAGAGEAESEISEPAAVTPADRFPPAVPNGLTAVASTASVELVWERSAEGDLGGYRVYRAEAGGEWTPAADTGETPSYSDRAVASGKMYRYAVSAVDRSGNESERSAPVEIKAP
jgi:hypothetical protein